MTNNPAASTSNPPSRFNGMNGFLSLAGFLSALALPVVLLFLGGDQVTRKGVMSAYIGTVIALFALFLLLILADHWLRKRFDATIDSLQAAYVTLIVPAVGVCISLTVIRVLPLMEYVWAVLSIHLLIFTVWWFGRKRIAVSTRFSKLNKWVVQLLPLFSAGILWIWVYFGIDTPFPGKRSILVLGVGLIVFAAFLRFAILWKINPSFRTHWWLYALLGLVLIGLVYQPELPFDRHHLGFFLAPVNDVLHGKWLFIDSDSQYGIGVIYALAGAFRLSGLPLSFTGFSLIVDILFILQYAVLFLILRRATGSLPLSLAGTGAILYFNFLAVFWPSMLRIPAQSPLRYGLIYLLLWIGLYSLTPSPQDRVLPIRRNGGTTGERDRLFSGLKRTFPRYLELIILGIASLWSLETFLYVFVSVNAFHFIADVLYAERIREGIRAFGKRIAVQATVILAAWAVWLIATLAAAGKLPQIRYYLDTYTSYTVAETYSHIVDFRSLSIGLVTAVYLVSVFAVFYFRSNRRNLIPPQTAALLAGFSAAGLMQNLYYFVYEIDYHLALICVPLIIVIALWLGVILHDPAGEKRPIGFKAAFGFAVLVSFWICFLYSRSNFNSRIRSSLVFQLADAALNGEKIVFADPYRAQPSNETVGALVALIERYAPDDQQIAVFARNEDQVESLLLTGKTSLLDCADPYMCAGSYSYSEFVLRTARETAGGPEYIFYDAGKEALIPLQLEAFRLLTAGSAYQVIDRIGDVVVYRKAGGS